MLGQRVQVSAALHEVGHRRSRPYPSAEWLCCVEVRSQTHRRHSLSGLTSVDCGLPTDQASAPGTLAVMSHSMWQPWEASQDPRIMKALGEVIERSAAKGIHEDEAVAGFLNAYEERFGSVVDSLAESLAGTLNASAPKMLAEHRRMRRGFENRLEWVWGEALDSLYQVYVCCLEIGESFNAAHRPAAVEEQDHRFEALVLIHSRACLIVSEIHALLRTGHAFGARARWRTLHELSVVASILAGGDDELSNRFLLHVAAEQYVDALLHEEHRDRTHREAIPAEQLEGLKRVHDLTLDKYGPKFADAWMWAEPVTAPERPTLKRLEKVAGLDHLRPEFRTSSHLLHGGASGADLVRVEYNGRAVLMSGPSNADLTVPGHGAAISLVQVTLALIIHGREFDYGPKVLASMQALSILASETGDAFVRGEEMLEALKVDFSRAESGGIGAQVGNNLRRSARRGFWRLKRRTREVFPRWAAVQAAQLKRDRPGAVPDERWRSFVRGSSCRDQG